MTKLFFEKTPGDLIPIAQLPSLLIDASPYAAGDLRDRIIKAILTKKLLVRTADGFPITVDELIENSKSSSLHPRIFEYFGENPDVWRGRFASLYQHLKNLYRDEKLREKLAKGLALHEHIAKKDLVAWLNELGIECVFLGKEDKFSPSPQVKNITQPATDSGSRIHTHSTKERRNELDQLLDEALDLHGYDVAAIWTSFTQWAEDQRPPLHGFDEAGGVKYKGANYGETLDFSVLTKKALSQRIARRKARTR